MKLEVGEVQRERKEQTAWITPESKKRMVTSNSTPRTTKYLPLIVLPNIYACVIVGTSSYIVA